MSLSGCLRARQADTPVLVQPVKGDPRKTIPWAQALEADNMRERLAEMLDQLRDARAFDEGRASEIQEADMVSQRRHSQPRPTPGHV
jgi:hypothetical protein